MKLLNGADIASYIKERHIRQVRGLIQAHGVTPKLAIVVAKKNDVAIETYTKVKQQYGQDILADVDVIHTDQQDIVATIETLNNDVTVHGIIVQLPLENMENVDDILNTVVPKKDVDGLGSKALFDTATPQAIDWLLVGYNIDLREKHICIVGNGKLVGAPLYELWSQAGYDLEVLVEGDDIETALKKADVVVSAAGKPRLIKSNMLAVGAIVIDAGTASDAGDIVGDVAEEVYDRDDITITPKKGGVGPLTVAVLFENVIRSARP